ncbi:RCC1 domain-containing protein [Candidatus Poriferisodalis sp.]|uniref:RCC1 domain-containing protein n=1 Tax=Candidatus Poriferisodalis sp. TaxID=3101277 RepID=UPI003B51C6A3
MVRYASQFVRAVTVLALCAAAVAVPIGASPAAAQSSALLPPLDDCANATPIVVASDAAAQSDIYSSVTLAGVLEAVSAGSTACIVLAGPRDGSMPAAQLARLKTARSSGYVVGGVAAVSSQKAPRGFTRIAGASRWATARNIGIAAYRLARGEQPAAAAFPHGSGHGTSGTSDRPALPTPDSCRGATPIVVASDVAAQSDIYSAVTLAGVLDAVDSGSGSCIVLAGHRAAAMPSAQSERLNAATGLGYVVGGASAVVQAKVPLSFRRVAGSDRWETARAVGTVALETARPSLNNMPPSGQEVVARADVGATGATLAGGTVKVTVPPGTFDDDSSVLIRAPLGQVGHLIGGDLIEVDHTGPINKPITVVWDVSELNEFQQAVLVLVRWNEQEQRWRAQDADFDIINGRLTAHLDKWSPPWGWITNAGSAVGQTVTSIGSTVNQTFGEFIGVKVDAPKCASPMPAWLTHADDPDEHSNSASIRLCYEATGDDVQMKTANNRNISRFVYPTGDIAWSSNKSSNSSLADLVVGETFGRWLENDTRVFFLPLQTRHIDLHRPRNPGTHSLTFQTEQRTIVPPSRDIVVLTLPDIVYSVLEQFELPFLKNYEVLEVLSPYLECTLAGVPALIGTPRHEWLSSIGQYIVDCFTSQNNFTDSALASADVDIHNIFQGFTDLAAFVDIVRLGYRITDTFITPEEYWTVSTQTTSGQATRAGTTRQTISAGRGNSCGIRNDSTVICWGTNEYGQSDAPSGSFTSVSTGYEHSCGIRSDGAATCWGSNLVGRFLSGKIDAPSGSFTSVSAGGGHSCGIRSDGTVTCWGWNWKSFGEHRSGQRDAPSGSFISVSAGYSHSCGVRSDSTVACWGTNDYGQSDAPSGSFISVSASSARSCGIRSDNTLICWGWGVDPPSGSFTSVSLATNSDNSCGLRANGTVVCWRARGYLESEAPPSGSFTSVAVGSGHACGLRINNTVTCWGNDLSGQSDAPPGLFDSATVGP